MDVIGASVGILLASPVMILTGAAVATRMGRPVFFRQRRPGFQGRPFSVVKFRTMREPEPGENPYATDEVRLTWLGRFLRRWSLDELPTLFNVLWGDMSLVGPRPLLLEYLDRYTPVQQRRHEMPPGITGWAQVNGRQDIPFSRRLELDVWYVEHWTHALDFKILAVTCLKVLRGSGVRSGQNLQEVDDLGLNQPTAQKVQPPHDPGG